MTNTAWLPRVLRWVFTVLAVLCGMCTVAVALFMLIDPRLPIDSNFGPLDVELMGQQGTIAMHNSVFSVRLLNGGLTAQMDNAAGLIEVVKRFGLPLALLNIIFFTALFDLLRRLFRNVGRGESFTQQTVRLVQIIGFSLLAFSLISAFGESWFHFELYRYLAQHATITISGTPIRLPGPDGFAFSSGGGDGSPFGSPLFFSGLLVLALSEVFRQGLVLKRENDLTV